jgi:hypothetical protein
MDISSHGLLAAAAATLLGSLWMAWRWWGQRAGGRSTQYTASVVLDSVEQYQLRQLQQCFPEHCVLAHVRMDALLRVVRAKDRQLAAARAARHVAQFVVIGSDGRPDLLFEADPHGAHTSSSEQSLRKKYALARLAGIPMVRIRAKDDIASDDFRHKVEAVLAKAREGGRGRAKMAAVNSAGDSEMPFTLAGATPRAARRTSFLAARS